MSLFGRVIDRHRRHMFRTTSRAFRVGFGRVVLTNFGYMIRWKPCCLIIFGSLLEKILNLAKNNVKAQIEIT